MEQHDGGAPKNVASAVQTNKCNTVGAVHCENKFMHDMCSAIISTRNDFITRTNSSIDR